MDGVLTAKERHQVVAVLRQLDPCAPAEQRREPRRKALVNLWIRRILKGRPRALVKLTLLNVSTAGIGCLAKSEFQPLEQFVMPLRFDEGGGWLVFCEVRNCKPLPNGHYKMGAKFLDRIEDPQGNAKIPGDWLIGSP